MTEGNIFKFAWTAGVSPLVLCRLVGTSRSVPGRSENESFFSSSPLLISAAAACTHQSPHPISGDAAVSKPPHPFLSHPAPPPLSSPPLILPPSLILPSLSSSSSFSTPTTSRTL